ncbi:YfhO family protein [Patescibacteria group bacterium]|nr:YfhO family protein [Patescibacteria group bacterium]MBU1472755.1 YfhO family protein [Patescibacteria group bacterium]MBU2460021.1 YfhO family protein [Patescibacteria group bacterium]MBU2544321.1 YfhO family protein [Patescibacteria group bacterium]
MSRLLKIYWPFLVLAVIVCVFFYKTVFFGLVPFPGDLLLSEYNPWRQYSFSGYAAGAVPNKAQYFDAIVEFFPWRSLVISALRSGHIPLWNPYNFSGTPLLANYQSAIFYPFNLLYLIIEQSAAWSVLIFIQPLLASFFTYLYLRKIRIGVWGGILGSIAFAYSSYMTRWLEFNNVGHAMLWLPMAIYAIESATSVSTSRFFILFVIALTSSLFAGLPLDFFYSFLVVLFYIIFSPFLHCKNKHDIRALRMRFFTLTFITLLVGAIQLLPGLELLAKSTRSVIPYDFFITNMLIAPWQLIVAVVPDFFGNPATRTYWLSTSYVALTLSIGLPPLLFALLSFSTIKNYFQSKFFALTSLIIIFFVVRHPLTELIYMVPIPLFSTSSPTRLLGILSFSLSVLAAYGVDRYIHSIKRFSQLKAVVIVIPVLLIAWLSCLFFIPDTYRTTAIRQLVIATVIAASTVTSMMTGVTWKSKKPIVMVVIILITVGELFYAFHKFNPFSPPQHLYPQTDIVSFLRERSGIDRFWGYGTAKIDANIATYYRLFSPDGFDALNIRRYNELLRASQNGKFEHNFTHINRSVAEIAPGYGQDDLPSNPYRLRMLDALGVRYVIDRVENLSTAITFPPDRFTPVWKDNGWTVFENTKAAPRYFLTHDVIPYRSAEEFENIFFSPDFNPTESILIAINDQPLKLLQDSTREVRLLSYTPTRVTFETKTQTPQLLYLSDADDGNWRASIDGMNSPILRANWVFRAVIVPAGIHTVELRYLPASFIRGVGVSGVTLVILLSAAGYVLLKRLQR